MDSTLAERREILLKNIASSAGETNPKNVTLLVGPQGEVKKFILSKCLLRLSSPVFAKLLEDEKGKPSCKIQDINPDVFSCILEYLYTQHLEVSCFEDALVIVNAAEKLGLDDLASYICDQAKKSQTSASSSPGSSGSSSQALVLYNPSDVTAESRSSAPEDLPSTILKKSAQIFVAKDAEIQCLKEENAALQKKLKLQSVKTSSDSKSPEKRPLLKKKEQEKSIMEEDEEDLFYSMGKWHKPDSEKHMPMRKSNSELEMFGKICPNPSGSIAVRQAPGGANEFVREAEILALRHIRQADLDSFSCTVVIRNSTLHPLYNRLYRQHKHTKVIRKAPDNIMPFKVYCFGFSGMKGASALFCYRMGKKRLVVHCFTGKYQSRDGFAIGFVPGFDSLKSELYLEESLEEEEWEEDTDRKKIYCRGDKLQGLLEYGGVCVQAVMSSGPHAVLKILVSSG